MWNWYKLMSLADLEALNGVYTIKSYSLSGSVENIKIYKTNSWCIIFRGYILLATDEAFVVDNVGAMLRDDFIWVGENAS